MRILCIAIDRLQPAYIGCYGNDWLTTASLDRLAAEGIVFDQHFADRPSPRGARRSWTELATSIAGVPGVTTGIIGDEGSPSRGSRFARGFQQQHWIGRHELGDLEQESLLGAVVQTGCEWLEAHARREHWLLWLELGSLRLPWDANAHDSDATAGYDEAALEPLFSPPTGFVGKEYTEADAERAAATYAGMVGGADQWLGQLMDYLKQKELYDEIAWIVTSDCGLPLGEHGMIGDHAPWLYEELVHLPLIVRLPKGEHAGRRISQQTQAAGLKRALADVGVTFGESAKGPDPGERSTSTSSGDYLAAGLRTRNEEEWSIRTRHWHLILPVRSSHSERVRPQLYIKPDDRWEINDVRAQHLEVAEHLELALRRHWIGELPPELREDVLRIVQS